MLQTKPKLAIFRKHTFHVQVVISAPDSEQKEDNNNITGAPSNIHDTFRLRHQSIELEVPHFQSCL
jgi:hypothetical protein